LGFARRLLRSKQAVIGGGLVLALVVVALLAPVLAPEGYDAQDMSKSLLPPGPGHPFGTDMFGRSLLSRIIWGSRVSLQIGVLAMTISLTVGATLGLISGYYGGTLDRILMGFMDVLLAFPGILLALAVVATLGPGLYNVMVAVGIQGVPQFARLIRGATLSLREKEFIEAVRAAGARDLRIMRRHVVPNVVAPVLIMASLDIGSAILSAAGLSFLGLGAQPPLPDWGAMISQGRHLLRSAWWVGVFPGLAILLTVLGFNLLGDGMRDVLDPRLRL